MFQRSLATLGQAQPQEALKQEDSFVGKNVQKLQHPIFVGDINQVLDWVGIIVTVYVKELSNIKIACLQLRDNIGLDTGCC